MALPDKPNIELCSEQHRRWFPWTVDNVWKIPICKTSLEDEFLQGWIADEECDWLAPLLTSTSVSVTVANHVIDDNIVNDIYNDIDNNIINDIHNDIDNNIVNKIDNDIDNDWTTSSATYSMYCGPI